MMSSQKTQDIKVTLQIHYIGEYLDPVALVMRNQFKGGVDVDGRDAPKEYMCCFSHMFLQHLLSLRTCRPLK